MTNATPNPSTTQPIAVNDVFDTQTTLTAQIIAVPDPEIGTEGNILLEVTLGDQAMTLDLKEAREWAYAVLNVAWEWAGCNWNPTDQYCDSVSCVRSPGKHHAGRWSLRERG